jgi:hypothetical protein
MAGSLRDTVVAADDETRRPAAATPVVTKT